VEDKDKGNSNEVEESDDFKDLQEPLTVNEDGELEGYDGPELEDEDDEEEELSSEIDYPGFLLGAMGVSSKTTDSFNFLLDLLITALSIIMVGIVVCVVFSSIAGCEAERLKAYSREQVSENQLSKAEVELKIAEARKEILELELVDKMHRRQMDAIDRLRYQLPAEAAPSDFQE
jgi:hypothetical protein